MDGAPKNGTFFAKISLFLSTEESVRLERLRVDITLTVQKTKLESGSIK